ncbi:MULTISPECIES: D-Ala-D-Ala carboxypeptidase family metallohydrolase [unclassified Psychrobacter]|uniref:D-Ala-D-Ala carboxypeptidase family metallohydrolase n=1 Tax=unclassified Psychrobacter TaxID=196806 RepID=UPI0009A8EB2A|nr:MULTISPECIES: D-Ala-D-Ala carboxypeptidase family metallohydrolase [unclassified Psychrobacter]MDE4454134.1 peptidase M15A [Psychrobacter sp. DAB_AL62B]OXL21520.1 peptidase M15A [Psychrobacter sp. DAB_AL32B]SLJ84526.1 peptidase M15A [Psychrobacter sp. DAB_AL43B]
MINIKKQAYGKIHQPIIALFICASSISAHAAIISDNSERRIQIRHGNSATNSSTNAYITPSSREAGHSGGVTILSGGESGSNRLSGDSMQGLIQQKQREFEFDASLSIEENKRVNTNKRTPSYNTTYSTGSNNYNDFTSMDFNTWLNSNSYRAGQVANYQRYLNSRVGARNVPPLSQLLTTARSWDKCGYEPYQLPPQELWSNIVPTLQLYGQLKNQGILPASTEIRSVYRSPGLNDCAGGASSSKHMTAGAIDIWVPQYEGNSWQLSSMQDSLCEFWQYQGQSHNFGLGLYSTGAIHLDTDGYRKWGFNHASSGSPCRY